MSRQTRTPFGAARASLVALLGSFGLASGLFVVLLALTYLGTLDQVEHGLLHAQQTYFDALLVWQPVGPVAVPLPGARLVLGLLALNLLFSSMARMDFRWSRIGVFAVHTGFLVLLAGGLISYTNAERGTIVLREGEPESGYLRENSWEVVLQPPDAAEAIIADVRPDGTIQDRDVPGGLSLAGIEPNALRGEDGSLIGMPVDEDPRKNTAGAMLVSGTSGQGVSLAVLWQGDPKPAAITIAGESWHASLRRKAWPLPCSLELIEFTRETHPGTDTPSAFSSELLRADGSVQERAVISMNAPMRYKGYTFYQSSWGPQNAGPGVPRYSVLEVARNPADRVPLYACALIAFGMVVHFGQKLVVFLRRPNAGPLV
ncbi:MAG: hypothetical protein GC168_15070 [Candidatus Hydrogenedens sp.]|nr:hypothetical protein [Candidatus Hydrogenedens sp.]